MKISKIKKVLIALDFNLTSLKVAEVGYSLALSLGAKVVIMHVISDLPAYSLSYLNMVPLIFKTGTDAKTTSQEFLDKVKLHLGNDKIETLLKQGESSTTILDTAKLLKSDIIVMGSHSSKWLESIIMGSVTADVLEKSSIPLLIVPTKIK